jgi:hypothetical protein
MVGEVEAHVDSESAKLDRTSLAIRDRMLLADHSQCDIRARPFEPDLRSFSLSAAAVRDRSET